MIMRLILLFLIVLFLIWIIRKQVTKSSKPPPNLENQNSEDMVACAHCGTHVPLSLALKSNNKYYCCKEHIGLDEQ